MSARAILVAAVAVLGIACNTRTSANDARCRTLSADDCRADTTCVAVGGPGLEPYEPAIREGKRCEHGCAKGSMPEECTWISASAAATPADPGRISSDGRVCSGPARCELRMTNSGDYCHDPDPPCFGCRQMFDHCQSANLCSGVICP